MGKEESGISFCARRKSGEKGSTDESTSHGTQEDKKKRTRGHVLHPEKDYSLVREEGVLYVTRPKEVDRPLKSDSGEKIRRLSSMGEIQGPKISRTLKCHSRLK